MVTFLSVQCSGMKYIHTGVWPLPPCISRAFCIIMNRNSVPVQLTPWAHLWENRRLCGLSNIYFLQFWGLGRPASGSQQGEVLVRSPFLLETAALLLCCNKAETEKLSLVSYKGANPVIEGGSSWPLKGPISKYHHVGSKGFNIRILGEHEHSVHGIPHSSMSPAPGNLCPASCLYEFDYFRGLT